MVGLPCPIVPPCSNRLRISALHHALQAATPGLTATTLQALDGSLGRNAPWRSSAQDGVPIGNFNHPWMVKKTMGNFYVFLTIHEGQHFGRLSIKQDKEGSRRIKKNLFHMEIIIINRSERKLPSRSMKAHDLIGGQMTIKRLP